MSATSPLIPTAKRQEALVHVIENVLGMAPKDTNPIWLALLNHHNDVESDMNIYESWLFLDEDKIDVLHFCPDPSKPKTFVDLGNGYKVHFARFTSMFSELDNTPGWDHMELFNITNEDYMQFSFRYIKGLVHTLPTPGQSLNQAYSAFTNPVALFEKTIKRDSKDFSEIKDLRQWDQGKRAWTATAKVQSISELLDPTYVPPAADKALFDLKNSYFYKVEVDNILEPSLRVIVNAGPKGDGQGIWGRIVAEAEKSTAARIASQKVTTYLSTSKIRDGSWKGTDAGYLHHWREMMRQLEEYSPSTPMGDHFKLTWLQAAVKDAPHLASVESTYDINTRMGSTSTGIDYNGYMEVLISAAQNYDSRVSATTRSQTRQVHQHQSYDPDGSHDSFSGGDYDIDTPIDTIWANSHHTYEVNYGGSSRVPDDAWSLLSDASRTTWNSIPIDDRKLIMGTSESLSSITDSSSTSPSSRGTRGRGRRLFNRPRERNRKVSFHLQSDDPTEDTSPTNGSDEVDFIEDILETYDVDFPTLCANVAERKAEESIKSGKHPHHQPTKRIPNGRGSTVPPGDVRRLLADNISKGQDVTIQGVPYTVKKAGTAPAPTDVQLSGVSYSVKMAELTTYCVSSTRHSDKTGALVDRGANGGIAGCDCRVIETNDQPQRFVNVEGIDGHVMSKRRLVTAGAVAESNRGPVILIMHQYALSGKGHLIHSSPQLEWNSVEVDDKSRRVGGLQRILTLDGYSLPLNIRRGLPYLDMRPFKDDEWEGPNSLPHVFLTKPDDWDPSVLDLEQSNNEDWFDSEHDPPLLNPDFDLHGDYRHRVISKADASVVTLPMHDGELRLESILVHEHDVYFDTRSDEVQDVWLDPVDIEKAVDSCVYRSNYHRFVQTANTDDTDMIEMRPAHHGARTVKDEPMDYEAMRPRFAWLPRNIIRKTFDVTTQLARIPHNTVLKKRYKSPNPALNVLRRNEASATDTIKCDTPAIDGGETYAQIFVGTKSLITDVYGIKSPASFPGVLTDHIIERGAPTKLVSDSARVEISKKVQEILRTYAIGSWQSEPYHQHQNPAERRYQDVKRMCNTVLDRSGAPAHCWLLCLMYVCLVLNSCFAPSINTSPLQYVYGNTNDISALLYFSFYEPVYYHMDDTPFPSSSKEYRGRWVGVSESVGNFMTFKILTDDTNRIIHRSNIRSATDPNARNLRIDPLNDEPPMVVRSWRQLSSSPDHGENDMLMDNGESPSIAPEHGESIPTTSEHATPIDTNDMVVVDPEDLVGRTFLLDAQEDGQRFRARIVEHIKDHESALKQSNDHHKFRISVNDDEYEEVISYNQLLDFIEKNTENDSIVWRFKRIVGHQGPLKPSDPQYKGSKYNVMIEWENGEITKEPLSVIAADDPVTCAIYAREHGLLEAEGWKRFKNLARREKHFLRLVKQAKLKSYRRSPKYKFGYQVPRDYEEAMKFDEINRNDKWDVSIKIEMQQLHDYKCFIDKGIYGRDDPPIGYKKIRAHLVFDVKHDGRHKARLVGGGHLTDVPVESVYSGVVSLRGLRMVAFLAELNGMDLWATDVGNAYLEAYAAELLYIVAGPEFGDLEGHILVISKALYGLRTSGLRWHERFSQCLREMGFEPSKGEPDIWMRRQGDLYEYIAVHVDDLCCASLDPKAITDTLTEKYGFKLKGTGPIEHHLGMGFNRNIRGDLCISPQRYIEKMVESYKRMFGEKPPSKSKSPLESNDHPEIDTSEFLDDEDTQKYMSLIGSMQWAVSIGRFDIHVHVMTMSSFRTAPRRGHLERAKRMVGYLATMKLGEIRVLTEEPDYSDLERVEYDWSKSVYGNISEEIPKDAPEALGGFVTLTHYQDANLFHDIITGRSVTGILHFLNKMPIDWYAKKQATVETATYGSEFISARQCIDQMIDLRLTLRYLGVPIRDVSYVFGDNKTVVDSSTLPHAKLHKRHNALSFHRVREAIASGYVVMTHLPGSANPSDILSKHWAYQAVWPILRPILFFHGNTADLIEDDVD